MRVTSCLLLGVACCILQLAPVQAEEPVEPPYPGEVALSRDEAGNWVYKEFPTGLPLYVFEGDEPGKSNCDRVCIAVWPILKAQENSEPIGQWTVIERPDGGLQWAYKGQPVYTFFQDSPGVPRGAGKREGWYYEEAEYDSKDDTPYSQMSDEAKEDSKKELPPYDERKVWRLLQP